MLFLLRKIRRKMIGNKKLHSYLFYAVGEIFLVVIGILIALQVNNWSEDGKKRKTEQIVLIGLKNDLNESVSNLNDQMSFINKILVSNKAVLNHLDNKPVNSDSIRIYYNRLFGGTSLQALNTSTFEYLNSVGLSIVRNNRLRGSITKLYTKDLRNTVSAEAVDQDLALQRLVDQLGEHVRTDSTNFFGTAYPINLEELRKNNLFREAIIRHIASKTYLKGLIKNTILNMEKTLKLIESELSKNTY